LWTKEIRKSIFSFKLIELFFLKFEALLIMLEIDEDKGIHKNACYALSCLCTSSYGYQLCIQSITLFHRILRAIETILLSIEQETVWFALM
jgi:hypothetical protein